MSDNSGMMTDAERFRYRLFGRLAIYAKRAADAKWAYAETQTQHAKHVFELNRQAMIVIIACYSDATNMSFTQAQEAFGVSDSQLRKLP